MAALRRAARAVLRCEHGAEDVAQDAWVVALGRSRVEAPVGSPFAWLAGVARHLVRREQRARGQRRSAHGQLARDELELRGSGSESAEPTVDAAVVSEAAASLAAAVHALPDHYRVVIVMRYWNGDSVAAIASRLDLPPKTVSNRLHRALTSLRCHFDARECDGPPSARSLTALASLALPKSGFVIPTLIAMKTLSAVLIGIVAAALLFLRGVGEPGASVSLVASGGVEPGRPDALRELPDGGVEGTVDSIDESFGDRQSAVSVMPAAAVPSKSRWSVSVEVEGDPSGTRIVSQYITGLDRGTSIRVLPDEVAPGEIAEEEFTAASVAKSGDAWTVSPSDPAQGSIVVACMVADRVYECRRVNPTTETVTFRVNALRARSLCCGSIRFRIADGEKAPDDAAAYGLSAGRGGPGGARAMMTISTPYEWQLLEGLPACALTLDVRIGGYVLGVPFELQPGQLLDLGTLEPKSGLEIVCLSLVDHAGERVRAKIMPMDLGNDRVVDRAQEFEGEGAQFAINWRAEMDLAVRVDAPGWSEVPIPIDHGLIPEFLSNEEMFENPIVLTAKPAGPSIWSFHPPTLDRGDYLVLRGADGNPIRTFAVTETRFVTSFLPAGTFLWTLHRSSGKEIGRVSRTIDPEGGLAAIDLRLDG